MLLDFVASVPARTPSPISGHDWLTWSGWAFGLVSVLWIMAAEWRLMSERRRLRRVAGQLEPSVPDTSPGTGSSVDLLRGVRSPVDDRVRSVLIQIAVDSLPFSMALQRAKRFGSTREDVERAAVALRESHLLKFDDPLEDSTRIRLT